MFSKKSEFLAELIGSMFLILLGCGVVAAVVICNNGAPVNIHLAWGLAVTFGIYVSGKRCIHHRRHYFKRIRNDCGGT